MLGPFVCGAGHLDGLATEIGRAVHAPFRINLVGGVVARGDELARTLEIDTRSAAAFLDRRSEAAAIDCFEIRLPPDLSSDAKAIRDAVNLISSALKRLSKPPAQLFVELPRDERFEMRSQAACEALATLPQGGPAPALKLRCGGMREEDFPSIEDIATFIEAVVARKVSFKATAGLHHPVRGWNAAQRVVMHGFLNVLFAATLHAAGATDGAGLREILEEEDPAAFVFEPERIRWRSSSASLEDLARARVRSIGSCSFDEPREDLVRLGWLRREV